MAGDRVRVVQDTVDLGAMDTEKEVRIPRNSTEFVLRLSDATTAWRWSDESGVVAAGGGFPMTAGESLAFAGPLDEQTIYVAHDSVGSVTGHRTYNTPDTSRP